MQSLDNERPLRALHLPDEAFLDGRGWLESLDAALDSLPNVTRVPDAPLLAPWRPDRAPISDWTVQEAISEAASQHQALASEARMRPPLTGAWPQALADAYRRLPDDFVLPPELAPLAYEHAPALTKTIIGYLQRRDLSR
ncbi:hypothetical protein AB0D63_30795 [Kitasatospora sp. NPDC048343]|uniref:hypothetical protein n=1 Tax=Kitasatospora sp. NPDC048343 TaxID=3154717 RepID=UPI0033D9396F